MRRKHQGTAEKAEAAIQSSVDALREKGAWIDYESFLPPIGHRGGGVAMAALKEEVPYAWAERYARLTPHATNLLWVGAEGFDYLFDEPASLVAAGTITAAQAVQDRLVGAHGLSRSEKGDRETTASRLAGAPRGPAEVMEEGRSSYDRGHVMAHSIGGGLDINLVPQLGSVNRRGLWRRMERYCQQNQGSYVFCGLVYFGLSGHPAFIEYGVLRQDLMLWLNVFRNYRSLAELAEIERLYRERDGLR
jgi:hypothetical protein